MLRDSTPRFVGPSVRPSVGPSVRHTLLFRRLWGFWLYRSYPNAPLTSNKAPARPHATGEAVYPALLHAKSHTSTVRLAIVDEFKTADMRLSLHGINKVYRRGTIPSRPCSRVLLGMVRVYTFSHGWTNGLTNEETGQRTTEGRPQCLLDTVQLLHAVNKNKVRTFFFFLETFKSLMT